MAVRRVEIGALTLGATDAVTGVKWSLPPGRGVQGWGSPASTASAVQRARGNGAWVGDVFMGARNLFLTGSITAPTFEAAEEAADALITAASLEPTLLTVHETGRSRSCMVQRRGEVVWDTQTDRYATWSIDLIAPDPRKLGATLSDTTGLPSSTGGVTFPLTFPLTFDAVTVSGQVSLTNPGNVAGPVRLRIDGPIAAPVVTHVNSGRQLVFSSSLVLGAGEFLTVDMDAQEVLAQGQPDASRAGWVTGRGWSAFEPGVNTWALAAASHSAGTMTVYATEAWG